MTEKTLEITSVAEFHAAVESTWSETPIFRGENRSHYPLRPKYGRHQVINPKNDASREKGMLAEFKRRATPMLEHAPENEWEWLAVAQHHGLATRLLDWTENVLVAAYFATLTNDPIDDCVIYVLNSSDLLGVDMGVDPFAISQNFLYRPRQTARRFVAQQGVFVAVHEPLKPFELSSLRRWVVKREIANQLAVVITTYGISHATVFPDLDGLSKDIGENWLWAEEELYSFLKDKSPQ